MLCGAFDFSGGPAAELEAVRRITARFPDAQTMSVGPFVLARGPAAAASEADGIHCVCEGRLHGAADPVDPHDRAAAGAEAITRGYQRSGTDILAELRGSYSVAIWDEGRREGLLTCDLLATRQWFIWRGSGYLLFATELRDLLAVVPARPGPDRTGFLLWLAGGTCPQGVTLYEGISRLGPGELLELSPASARTIAYWRPRYAGTLRGSRAELAGAFREQLEQATVARLSGLATGVVLSGGFDSSIVTAFAAKTGARVRTYSAVFPGAEFDESDKIAELTSALGLDPAAFRIEPRGTLRVALEHTKRWGLPLIGAGAMVDIAIVAEAARDGADVVLDGQTGDEVLGFAPYLVADRLRQGRFLAALELTRRWPLGRPTTRQQKVWILHNLGLKKAAPVRLARWVVRRRNAPAGPGMAAPRPSAKLLRAGGPVGVEDAVIRTAVVAAPVRRARQLAASRAAARIPAPPGGRGWRHQRVPALRLRPDRLLPAAPAGARVRPALHAAVRPRGSRRAPARGGQAADAEGQLLAVLRRDDRRSRRTRDRAAADGGRR